VTNSFPIGIDVGETRVRIAHVAVRSGTPTLATIASRDLPEESANDARAIGLLIREMLDENHIRERRCVGALGEPEAIVRAVTFPDMPARERERAARYEAARFVDYSIDDAWVRIFSLDRKRGSYALGIAREKVVRDRIAAFAAAGLRAVALHHAAAIYRVIFPTAGSVVDIGHARTRLYALTSAIPAVKVIEIGGRDFTNAIATSMQIGRTIAETRKRTVGLAGAADGTLRAFAKQLASALSGHEPVSLCGNGARLIDLPRAIESVSELKIEVAREIDVSSASYAEDVIRAAAPDVSLAIALALHLPRFGRAS